MQLTQINTKPTRSSNSKARQWGVIVAMGLLLFLLSIDGWGVSVIVPDIGKNLQLDNASLEWIMNAFGLAFAVSLIAVGKLADHFGKRSIVLLGALVFTFASALCGFSTTEWILLIGRALQGIGAALIYVSSLSIVSYVFPPEKRGMAIGVWSSIGLIGAATGPMIAGAIAELASWHWLFFINLPFGIIAFVLTLILVQRTKSSHKKKFDLVGFSLMTAALIFVVFALQEITNIGIPAFIILLLVGFVGLLLALQQQSTSNQPFLDLELFRNRRYIGASLISFVGYFGFGTVLFLIPLYLQLSASMPIGEIGVFMLAFSAPLTAVALTISRLIKLLGKERGMAIGVAFVITSFVILTFGVMQASTVLIVIGLISTGIGQGLAYNVSTVAAIDAVPENKAGIASGMFSTVRGLGWIVGVALTGALFSAIAGNNITSKPHLLPGQKIDFVFGLQSALLLAAAVLTIGLVAFIRITREGARIKRRSASAPLGSCTSK